MLVTKSRLQSLLYYFEWKLFLINLQIHVVLLFRQITLNKNAERFIFMKKVFSNGLYFLNDTYSISIESHRQCFPIFLLMKEDFSPARASNIASQVSLIMSLRVSLPTRYANDDDCCDFPDTKMRKVTESFSPTDIALRKFMVPF